jgi:tripartite-type tricarboxylate transporter receptor subunit TctC
MAEWTAASTAPKAPSIPPEVGTGTARPSSPNLTSRPALPVAPLSVATAVAGTPRPLLAASRARKASLTSLTRGTSGAGTVYRAGTLALEREAGVDLAPKSPGKKTPTEAIYDGDVETALVPADGEILADVWAGELQALAVLGGESCPDLPKVPTAKELGYDVTVPVFGGIAAPAGTPRRIVDELGRAFVGASSSREFGRVLVGTGRVPAQRGPEKFAAFVDEQARGLSEADQREGG